jgi:glycosyltransferase involved in cell wall biosynthesis
MRRQQPIDVSTLSVFCKTREKMMRIAVHDFVGHPFQVQLSRELARRGHTVLHLYLPAFNSPKGRLARSADDPPGFDVAGVKGIPEYPKYSYISRYRADKRYARNCAAQLEQFHPDVVLSGNAPPDIQAALLDRCHRNGAAFVYWVQDFYAEAVGRLLRKRFGFVGGLAGAYFRQLDARALRESDQVVLITDDFAPIALQYGVPAERCHVIENWAVLDELPHKPRNNAWSRRHQLNGKTVFLYSGTLGLKHNPDLLVKLAQRFQERADVAIVVVSEGLGRDWLEKQKSQLGLANLQLLDFQPFDLVPDMTASADALLAFIEEEAGVYSVPSKVLTYLCARRPILLSSPASNLAARLIRNHSAGLTVTPGDTGEFLKAADLLAGNTELASRFAQNARAYAEQAFKIETIAARFENVLDRACTGYRSRATAALSASAAMLRSAR